MITLALFEKMDEDKVAGLTKNKDFFWEEMPLQKDGKPAQGVWLITRGGDNSLSRKGLNMRSTVDFYVAFKNKVQTETVQRLIQEWLTTTLGFCELSGSVGGMPYSYTNIRVRPTTTPENAGVTENGLIVKVTSAQLIYDNNN